MEESEVPVRKICKDCFFMFKGHNQICPSCGSSSIGKINDDQDEIKPSINLVFTTLPIGYGGIE